ncbi:MAG: GMC family oxidoreductase [Myxococcota bacterium]
MSLNSYERRALLALAETVIPAGRMLPAASTSTVDRTEALLGTLPEAIVTGYRGLLSLLELGGLQRFSSLPLGRRVARLETWERTEGSRLMLRGLLSAIKLAYFEDPAVHRALECRFALDPPQGRERARFRDRITDASTLPEGTSAECEVVIVGTGAGGAPMAKALAERGIAVMLLEEGPYFERKDFTGRPREMVQKMYKKGGVTVAFGNTAIPIPLGRGVGGTTLVNSGTCFRAPQATRRHWREGLGLAAIADAALDPYYAQVEEALMVGPSSKAALGKPAEIIARGADRLGWSHHPLLRNAPGCDGQGLCCFGCPTDAKRSTNVSFVPAALERGAELWTGFRVDEILTERGAAVGVRGKAGGRSLEVRAKVVVLSCGSIETPILLAKNRLGNTSGELGKNLSIHPASSATAIFDEEINGWNRVPQGYAVDQFKEEGILFEGSSVPLDITAVSITGYGPSYVAQMEAFNRTLQFGFLIKDESRGRVSLGGDGEARIQYWVNDRDAAKLQRAVSLLSELYFAAGAKEVLLPVAGHERLRDRADLARFQASTLRARHIDLTAYHPLGTARMGTDPLRSVVDSTQETWDVHNLFVSDGSVIPGALGVNPQMTIMALALRAAEHVARRVEKLAG